jgi:hypothetical protein
MPSKQYADPSLIAKKQVSKKIIFPIFEKASELINDDYWKQILQDASHGKFPKNSGIDPKTGGIFVKKGKQTLWLELPLDPEKALEAFKKFLSENLNLRSKKDQKSIRKEIDKQRKELLENLDCSNWKDIRKKAIKDSIIRDFVINLKRKYELTDKEAYDLYNLIKLGILFNWIDSSNITYRDRKIKTINVLYFNKKTRHFFIDHDYTICVKREWDLSPRKLSEYWNKYH